MRLVTESVVLRDLSKGQVQLPFIRRTPVSLAGHTHGLQFHGGTYLAGAEKNPL